jgi:hypothetical protein
MKERLKPEINQSRFNSRHCNSRTGLLSKSLLAITLTVVAFAPPALAAFEKDQSSLDQRHVNVPAENQWMLGNAQSRHDRQHVDDPYWTPCDYSSSSGTNSCE